MRSKGFTLIELMVVVSLFSLILFLSWPAFGSLFKGYQLEATAQELKNCMILARASAIGERVRYRIQFQQDPAAYVLYREDNSNGASIFLPSTGKWGRVRMIPGDIVLQSVAAEIYFYPNGTATPIDLALKGKHSREIDFHINEYSGQIEWTEKSQEQS